MQADAGAITDRERYSNVLDVGRTAVRKTKALMKTENDLWIPPRATKFGRTRPTVRHT